MSQEHSMLGVPDNEHLVFALREERVILTQDTDFLRLHADGQQHCGIIYASQALSIGSIISGCLLIATVLDSEDMRNHVEFL